jgi:hypothetical protein
VDGGRRRRSGLWKTKNDSLNGWRAKGGQKGDPSGVHQSPVTTLGPKSLDLVDSGTYQHRAGQPILFFLSNTQTHQSHQRLDPSGSSSVLLHCWGLFFHPLVSFLPLSKILLPTEVLDTQLDGFLQ